MHYLKMRINTPPPAKKMNSIFIERIVLHLRYMYTTNNK